MEDAQNRAEIKLKRAVEEVKKLLIPAVSICLQAFDFHFLKVLLKYNKFTTGTTVSLKCNILKGSLGMVL